MANRPLSWRSWLLFIDALSIATILAICIWSWPVNEGPIPGHPGLEIPKWGSAADLLLIGPDAGMWGQNILAIFEGRLQDVEAHRLPTWPLLTAGVMHLGLDVVQAGHLVNHLLLMLAGLMVYLLGRAGGGPGVGFGAAVLTILSWDILTKSQQFSVDIAVVAFVVLSLHAAHLACKRKYLAPLAGVVAALTMETHFTLMPYALPALALMLMRWRGRWSLRLLGVGGFLLGCLGMLGVLFIFFPAPTLKTMNAIFSEGITHGLDQGSYKPIQVDVAVALENVLAGVLAGIPASAARIVQALKVDWCMWALAVVLPWIGVLGLGLGQPPAGRRVRARRFWSHSDVAMGLALLFCLAPLPFLEAAKSPERYALNLLPVAALLFMRGLASVCAGFDALIRVWFKRWPPGILAGVVGGLVALVTVNQIAPHVQSNKPLPWGLADLAVGRALAQTFPAGVHVASPLREVLVYSGHRFCPWRHCPVGNDQAAFKSCLQIMSHECKSKGAIPYLAIERASHDPRRPNRKLMDAWILSRYKPVRTLTSRESRVHILKVPWP